jgi:hypothetical protein
MQDDDRGTLSKRELTRIGHREFAAVQILELSPSIFAVARGGDVHRHGGIESMSRGSSVLDERPSKDTPLLERRIGTLHSTSLHETVRRREAALKRMLSTPHKPHKPIGKSHAKRQVRKGRWCSLSVESLDSPSFV